MMRRWRRDESGALAAEFVGVLPILLLLAIIGWQLLMTTGAASATATAARNGARAASMDQDCAAAVYRTLPGWLPESRVTPSCEGARVTVEAEVPTLFPGGPSAYTVSRTADLPNMSG